MTQAKFPTLSQAGKSSSSLSCCKASSFFYLHLLFLPHLHPGFLTMFLMVLVFAAVYSVFLMSLFQKFLAVMTKIVSLKLSRRAWWQSLLPDLEDDFPGDPLDGGLVGVVVGLPGQD